MNTEGNSSFKLTKKWIFLLALGAVLILALVFLLGARLGGNFSYNPEEASVEEESQIESPKEVETSERQEPTKLTESISTKDEETYEPDNQLDAGAPKYEVTSEGDSLPMEEAQIGNEPAASLGERQQDMDTGAGPMYVSKNPHTMIRFKSSGHSRFAVQIGEYHDEALATKVINDLHKKGYDAYLVIENPNSYARNYCVRVGAFPEHQAAETLATSLSNDQGMELQVVRIQ